MTTCIGIYCTTSGFMTLALHINMSYIKVEMGIFFQKQTAYNFIEIYFAVSHFSFFQIIKHKINILKRYLYTGI